jgi:hypothetical protein
MTTRQQPTHGSPVLFTGLALLGAGFACYQLVGGVVGVLPGHGNLTDRMMAGLLAVAAGFVLLGWAHMITLVRRNLAGRALGRAGIAGQRLAVGLPFFAILPTWITLGDIAVAAALAVAFVVGSATNSALRRIGI